MAGIRKARPKLGPSTPLQIIGLFFSLAEAAMAYAATRTTEGVQIAFTVFAMFFALFVAVGFFIVLWHRPERFYSPTEYGGMDPGAYAAAMRPPQQQQPQTTILSMTTTLTEQTGVGGADEQRTADALIASTDDPYWSFLQAEVDRFLTSKGVTSPAQVIRVLRRFHALTWAESEFERIDAIIFGGQIAILEALSRVGPATSSALARFHEVARAGEPEFFENNSITPERYLGFLQSTELVQNRPDVAIDRASGEPLIELTLKGHSFLTFRTRTNKLPRHY